MRFVVRAVRGQDVLYFGKDKVPQEDVFNTLPWSSFDDAHDLVETFREEETLRNAEVVPHPHYENNPDYRWGVFVGFLLGIAFIIVWIALGSYLLGVTS